MTNHAEPGVTVEALLDRVRAEVARRHGQSATAAPPSAAVALAPDFQRIQVLLGQATGIADVGARVPPFAVFGPVRRVLARALTRILYFFLRVISVDQRVYNGLVLQMLRDLSAGLRQGETALAERLHNLVALHAGTEARLARLDADVAAQASALQTELAAAATQLRAEVATRADREAEQARDMGAQLAHVREDLDTIYRRVGELEAAQQPGAADAASPSGDLAALYVAFEDRFRGERQAIAERVREHLPIVQAAGAGTAARPILDLGCGRGEWLEVLREAELHASGVDANPLMVEQCRGRGLEVALDDALGHLRSRADASCGAVTAVHLVEHLPFATLIALFDETVRVLAPGGVAIFETPNAYHLLVGACTFHTDPTHQQPLAPDVLAFLAEARGLAQVAIRLLHRAPPLPALGDAPILLQRLAPHLHTAEDFAVIGYRT